MMTMTMRKLKSLIKKGDAFLDIDYPDFKIYHDVMEDQYFVTEDNKTLKQVTLVVEVRYPYNYDVDLDDELISGTNFVTDFDFGGEFDEMDEEMFRYGYFKYVNDSQPDVVTRLIEIK